ncbi:helix-turn-helix domain-containing protein [Labrys monachus]|uniref:Transcriptional regulator with XRE-family HTH domain n=1 Tax=Labrys monachus TaxID=217067 RepID=A0ABU0FJM5_9HYPH|nr:XRE family transcriptional regulator [Labrys monachus]MDQ0394813.1 transcriptional regulator with XRE-family HTH domain [Labrys monachus]
MDLTSAQIGERLRVLRKERGWTLQELSRRAGVSLSAVSKIENAQVAPTFDTLVKVARGLGLGFDALLDQVSTGEANAPARGGGRLSVTRKNDAVGFSTAMYEYNVHASGLRRKYMTPLIMAVKARRESDATAWSSHEGEEFIFVIKGRIALYTEFYEPVKLDQGDSVYFDSSMSHMFLNIGRGEALMASICYSNAIDRPMLAAGTGGQSILIPGTADAMLDEET